MKILLLAGGDSSERSVSIDSGQAIYEALKRQDHIVYAIDPSTGKSLLNSDGSFISYSQEEEASLSISSKKSTWPLSSTLGSPAFQDIEVVVIALHGGSGEDGMLQCLLEVAGKKHTGSNMTASAVAMDKAISKRLCQSENIDTPKFAIYRLRSQKVDDRLIDEIDHTFEYPIIVKPNDGGSTIGLSKVNKVGELREAMEKALLESQSIIIEKFIKGREIQPRFSTGNHFHWVEIIPQGELYDF